MREIIFIFYLIYVLFLPGFVLSLILFAKQKIDITERIVFSVALSITILPLLAFYSNLMGVPITKATIALQILCVTGVFILILIFQKRNELYEKK